MKKWNVRWVEIFVTGLIFFLLTIGSSQAEVKIGILAKRGAMKTMQKWKATGEALSASLGDKVVIIPLKFTAIEPMVKDGKIDFLLANSAFYVEMEKKYQAKAIATLINSRRGKALQTFGGVVLTKKDSPINNLADIKGKKFMLVKFSSFGGGHMAWRLLLDNGIDPKKDFAAFVQGNKHDNVVMAVKRGVMDAGTVRSDTLERMAAEGKIKLSEFKIIHQIKDDFPFVHSTQLYPEWPMAAMKHTDPALAAKVAAALIATKSDSAAAQAAKIIGWAPPADYTPVTECLKAIKYGAFAH